MPKKTPRRETVSQPTAAYSRRYSFLALYANSVQTFSGRDRIRERIDAVSMFWPSRSVYHIIRRHSIPIILCKRSSCQILYEERQETGRPRQVSSSRGAIEYVDDINIRYTDRL